SMSHYGRCDSPQLFFPAGALYHAGAMEVSQRDNRDEHLSRISTLWTMVRQAHAAVPDTRAQAHQRLLERYQGAVYAYLRGAVCTEAIADDLFQEFALRVVRGDFSRAKPEKGRFRDYLRTSL